MPLILSSWVWMSPQKNFLTHADRPLEISAALIAIKNFNNPIILMK
jgi:hypothetical protein